MPFYIIAFDYYLIATFTSLRFRAKRLFVGKKTLSESLIGLFCANRFIFIGVNTVTTQYIFNPKVIRTRQACPSFDNCTLQCHLSQTHFDEPVEETEDGFIYNVSSSLFLMSLAISF